MKRIFQFLILLSVSLSLFTLYINSVDSTSEERSDYYENYKRDYRIYSPPLPTEMNFAGENVPLNLFYVSEMLDRELLVNSYWQSSTLLMFKRAYRWFPIIEPILKKNGVPDDFKYLAVIESSLTNVTSPAGAKGYWQIMKATGIELGLEINAEIDERLDVEKSTEAACKYLLSAYRINNSWTEAAASYNMGMAGIRGQLKKQAENSFYDLALNNETSRYIFRILAIKAIFTSPQTYGFYLRNADLYPPLSYDSITFDSSITNLSNFAHAYGMSYRMFKELNPSFLTNSIIAKPNKTYKILIPKKELTEYTNLREKQSHEIGIFGDRK